VCTGNQNNRIAHIEKGLPNDREKEGANRSFSFTIDDSLQHLKTGEPFHEGQITLKKNTNEQRIKNDRIPKKKGYTTIPPSDQQTA